MEGAESAAMRAIVIIDLFIEIILLDDNLAGSDTVRAGSLDNVDAGA